MLWYYNSQLVCMFVYLSVHACSISSHMPGLIILKLLGVAQGAKGQVWGELGPIRTIKQTSFMHE